MMPELDRPEDDEEAFARELKSMRETQRATPEPQELELTMEVEAALLNAAASDDGEMIIIRSDGLFNIAVTIYTDGNPRAQIAVIAKDWDPNEHENPLNGMWTHLTKGNIDLLRQALLQAEAAMD